MNNYLFSVKGKTHELLFNLAKEQSHNENKLKLVLYEYCPKFGFYVKTLLTNAIKIVKKDSATDENVLELIETKIKPIIKEEIDHNSVITYMDSVYHANTTEQIGLACIDILKNNFSWHSLEKTVPEKPKISFEDSDILLDDRLKDFNKKLWREYNVEIERYKEHQSLNKNLNCSLLNNDYNLAYSTLLELDRDDQFFKRIKIKEF